MTLSLSAIPLGLYVHIPWCVRKCPYCDFNSHTLPTVVPEAEYLQALLADLELDAPLVAGRTVSSIFIGGGTPSLMQPTTIATLLQGIAARLHLDATAEITLEANPGTVEQQRFEGFRAAGINRLSIGVQSFADERLQALGRIHNGATARQAVETARRAGFDNINIDLMYGLPGQDIAGTVADIDTALGLAPSHLSHYQLTLEPNTLFHRHPPTLPDDDSVGAMQEACQQRLAAAGFEHYEVSAYAPMGRRCQHNLNYWQFGDYLGIGAGAHAKLTVAGEIRRMWKIKHPRDYLRHAGAPGRIGGNQTVVAQELGFEFMMNALRLREGVSSASLIDRTGLTMADLQPALADAVARDWVTLTAGRLAATDLGWRFLDDVVAAFLPEEGKQHAGSR